jgi:Holliday junction resolvasome RuvABC endonuclease subunit
MGSVLGVDLALTGTGVAGPEGWTLNTIKTTREGWTRLAYIRDAVVELACYDPTVTLVVLEGYSFASKGRSLVDLGELGGVVRLALWERGIPFADVAPQTMKKFATGSGGADKGQIIVKCVRRLDIDPGDDNQADAAWFRAMGLYHLWEIGLVPNSPLKLPLALAHLAAYQSVRWPALDANEKLAG